MLLNYERDCSVDQLFIVQIEMEPIQEQDDFQLFNVLWCYTTTAQQNGTADLLPQIFADFQPKDPHNSTKFKSIAHANKDEFRNVYGLDFKRIRKSASNPSFRRIIKKLCERYGWRSNMGVIKPQEIIDLDKETKGHLVNFQKIPAFFYSQNASQHEKIVRYIFGRYFVWFGRKRFVLDILKTKKIKEKNKTDYLQVMSMLVQRVQSLLEKIDQEERDYQHKSADEHAEKYY